ncbi:threonine/serine dehydratase [Sphingomonas sediminicola]|uniref:Threonine/serine dehydratase n=1 Tax=Sphingomonas sediminicola TaxID=386874 RepID=A0ABX6TD72_9SPHN|nr:threonine/serine dehydratase [Sphingomonas sediminicola]QNP46703.1 threonine/serine dehydratase [Sphingomonas sediminicola]
MNDTQTVTRTDVVEAGRRIAASIEHTPLIGSDLDGRTIWLKCECLQTGGAFKLRGASNRLLQLSEEERKSGVVAFSSGNHARGVAIAARRLGIRAIIVMPKDAPAVKVDGTRAEGAEIIFFDRYRESREAIAERISKETGATVVPSFDDAHIVAGQGTVGLEILEQMPEAPTRIVVPCGGGGLASGIVLACPDTEIVIVEPEGWDDMKRSLEVGEIVPVSSDASPTLCDALQTPRVSPITFEILRNGDAKALSASEEAVRKAIRWAWERHQLVVEPGGAVALAVLLSGQVEPADGTVVVLSGGNIDPALHAEIVA